MAYDPSTIATAQKTTLRWRGRAGSLCVALTLLFAPWALAPSSLPAASAEPPARLQQQVTDLNGVLGAQAPQVASTLADLRSQEKIQLWVVLVDSFDGLPAQTWAERTRATSDLGPSDALLAVATGTRSYYFWLDTPTRNPEADTLAAREIADNQIEPKLAVQDWAGAVAGAADGLAGADPSGTRATGTSSGTSPLWLLAALLVIAVIVGLVLWGTHRRRQSTNRRQAESAADISGDDTQRLSRLPLEVLDLRARAGLVDADQAIEASTTALDTAAREFGDARSRPFRQALEQAKAQVSSAHALIAQLDDSIPESREEKRRMLLEIAARSERAERALAEQSRDFSQMLDLLINGESRANALIQREVSLRARIPKSEEALDELRRRFPSEVLTAIADNIPLATALLDSAEQQTERARGVLSQPAGQQAEAVDAITTAEGALARAEKLLDGIDHAGENIAAAQQGLPEMIAEVEDELRAAAVLLDNGDLAAHTTESLRGAASEARSRVAEAQASGPSDPLGVYSRLVDADRQLDEALAAAGDEAETADRARIALAGAVGRARAAVREAEDYISARSYVIGQAARTSLSSARDALLTAENSHGPDAFTRAERAIALAGQALRQAQEDASRAQYSGRYGRRGGSNTGAVVGGMIAGALIEGMLRGAGSSFGSGSGWRSGGGHTGGGFGGGGIGGRF